MANKNKTTKCDAFVVSWLYMNIEDTYIHYTYIYEIYTICGYLCIYMDRIIRNHFNANFWSTCSIV